MPAIAIIPAAFHESAAVSLRPMASRTRLSRNAGKTPSPAETTMRSSTAPSRSLYGQKSHPMRRRFALRTAGSAARSGGASAEWKNMPIRAKGTRGLRMAAPPQLLRAESGGEQADGLGGFSEGVGCEVAGPAPDV